MLPGPPSELEPMMKGSVIPLLRKRQDSVIVSHNVHVYGRGEAMVAQMMDDLMESENPTLAPYAKDGEMFLRVTAKSKDEKAAEELCAPLIEEIKKRVGSYVYGVDANTLEELVVKLLKKKKKKIAVAESCTGGLLAKRITDVAGSSEVFELGCVTYANSVKEKILGVERLKLEKHGAVSPEVAVEMAEGVRKLSDADIGIGITGIAGPGGGTDEKPVGLVYIALSDGKETFVNKRNPVRRNKDRDWHRLTAASSALDMVRRYLTGLDVIPKD